MQQNIKGDVVPIVLRMSGEGSGEQCMNLVGQ